MSSGEYDIEDVPLGLELNLMTQEQVVSEFRALVSRDIGMAALHYNAFAQKLESVAFDSNAQVRSLAGGPDSLSAAELVDAMVGNYASASNDVKERIIDLAVSPFLRENSFYVTLAVARMKNPHVVADIIRKYPLFNPGLDFYEGDLLQGDNLSSAGHIQEWLNKFGGDNLFSATAVALQLSVAGDVAAVMQANPSLFDAAAHVVASHHDMVAKRRLAKHPELDEATLLEEYRSGFVENFATIVRQKAAMGNWLTVAEK